MHIARRLAEGRVVFPGRFQPPHYGHIHAIRWLAERFKEVVIVVGSAQKSHSIENPLTAGERILMLREALREEGLDLAAFVMVPVPDIEYNTLWVRFVESLTPPFEYAATRNPLVKVLFEEMGYKVVEPPALNRREYSGRYIRRLMVEGDERWKSLVPRRVVNMVEELGVIERMRTVAGTDEEG